MSDFNGVIVCCGDQQVAVWNEDIGPEGRIPYIIEITGPELKPDLREWMVEHATQMLESINS